MSKITIIPLKSLNGIPFGASKEEVRKVLGNNYENSIELREKNKKAFNSEPVKLLEDSIRSLYKEMGKDPASFEWPDISEFVEDCDTYPNVQVEYQENKFVSATIYASSLRNLTIWNHDCSDFEIEKLLTLADDFEWDEEETSWTSLSQQISIYCALDKRKMDSILFGCPGYYDSLDKEEE